MERVLQYQRLPTTAALPVRLPPYFRLTLALLISILLSVIGVLMATRRAMSDPFSAYMDLFGDDAGQAALAHGFACSDAEHHDHLHSISDYCAQRDTDEVFSGIYLRMSGNDASEISFWLRENTLMLGDLVFLWENPEIQCYSDTIVASWPARHIMIFAAPSQTRHIYFLPVQSVSFTRSGPPDWWKLALVNTELHHCGSVGTGWLTSYSGGE